MNRGYQRGFLKVASRSYLRQLRLDLLPGVPEDLDGGLGHLVILHLQALQQGLVRLGRVEGGGMGERQHLRGEREVRSSYVRAHTHTTFTKYTKRTRTQTCTHTSICKDKHRQTYANTTCICTTSFDEVYNTVV